MKRFFALGSILLFFLFVFVGCAPATSDPNLEQAREQVVADVSEGVVALGLQEDPYYETIITSMEEVTEVPGFPRVIYSYWLKPRTPEVPSIVCVVEAVLFKGATSDEQRTCFVQYSSGYGP